MILTPHIIVGAVIGAKTHNLGLIIILGLATHLLMDIVPHWDYSGRKSIQKFKETKQIKFLIPFFIKLTIDLLIGLLAVYFMAQKQGLLDIKNLGFMGFGIMISGLPDLILFLMFAVVPEPISAKYIAIHTKYLHFYKDENEKEGKITFLRSITEIAIIIISLLVFFG